MGCDETTFVASRSSPAIVRLSLPVRSEWDWHNNLASPNRPQLVRLYLRMNDGGMGLGRRAGSRPLQGSTGLHDMSAPSWGVDGHCHTLLGCNLRRGLLQHGEHLTRQCEHWSSVTEVDMGGPVAA